MRARAADRLLCRRPRRSVRAGTAPRPRRRRPARATSALCGAEEQRMTGTAELAASARVVSPVAAFDSAAWDALAGPSFYTSSRWLRACEGLLSERSAVVWVGDVDERPVAALAAYLVHRDAYLFLNPPALLPVASTQPELARFQSPETRDRVAALARSLAPSLEARYPVAVCVSPFG